MQIDSIKRERAMHLVDECEIEADGHRLMTLGPHTGHVWQVVALCDTAEIAAAIAAALNKVRKQRQP